MTDSETLKDVKNRIVRIESRLVQLMQFLKADKHGRYEPQQSNNTNKTTSNI
jgi:hypothetical protein